MDGPYKEMGLMGLNTDMMGHTRVTPVEMPYSINVKRNYVDTE